MRPGRVVWRGAPAAWLAGALLTTGCSAYVQISTNDDLGIPVCTVSKLQSNPTILMAQAVPSAQQIPCMRSVPVGWTFARLQARNGEARFILDNDREGVGALTVILAPTCPSAGATEVPSDQPGARRYERVTRVSPGYGGDRYYVSPGSCITYHFNLQGQSRAGPVAEISDALGVVPRSALARQVKVNSGGRLELDPTGGTG